MSRESRACWQLIGSRPDACSAPPAGHTGNRLQQLEAAAEKQTHILSIGDKRRLDGASPAAGQLFALSQRSPIIRGYEASNMTMYV